MKRHDSSVFGAEALKRSSFSRSSFSPEPEATAVGGLDAQQPSPPAQG